MKRPSPDTRLDWRDLQMPVIRDYRFRDGRIMTNVDPEYERRYREMLVSASNNPKWDKDPTYNMRRSNCPTTPSEASPPKEQSLQSLLTTFEKLKIAAR